MAADPAGSDLDPRLREWIDVLTETRWAAMVLDADSRLVWVSEELQGFIGAHDSERLGIGKHIAAALLSEAWLRTITPESALRMFREAMPFFLDSLPGGAAAFADTLDPPLRPLVDGVTPQRQPDLLTGCFDYRPQADLRPYEVRYLVALLRDEGGAAVGSFAVTYLGLRPTLVSLLARGDQTMYERMAALVEPRRHASAILFVDVQDSGELSRRLPTPRYFELIRALATIFDDLVGANCGVVGKHAGDGMTAFFLADGDPSRAAAGALRTVRGLQRWAAELGAQLDGAGAPALRVNCALHWGANLYMGQVVPGGRLDVSALGDEVNECARMQESTRDGAVSMSKEFAELLPPDAPASLGVDAARLLYQPLSALPGATQKAIRDAGTLAVAQI